jgi:phosphoglycolate phosphatase
MSTFDLFIFDFDGTLCATHEAICYCLERTLEHYGAPIPPLGDMLKAIGAGISLADTLLRFSPSLAADGPEAVDAWVTTYRAIYNSGEGQARTVLFEGALDVLQALSACGASIVVVSNKGEKAVHAALDQFGIKPYVSLAVCDTKGIEKKPKPDSFHKLIQPRLGPISVERTLVIGDTTADILYARNIGAASCWAAHGYGAPEECAALAPEYTIHGLCQLPAAVGLNRP